MSSRPTCHQLHPDAIRLLGTVGLLCTVGLSGCSLTAMLWSNSGKDAPLAQVDTLCRVHRVAGSFLPASTTTKGTRAGGVVVDFSVYREKDTPRDIDGYLPNEPGRLRIDPPQTEANWFELPGAGVFQPKLWEFGAFRGSYFVQNTVSVPLVFIGEMQPARLGTLLQKDETPEAWRRLPPIRPDRNLHHLMERSIAALAKHDWVNVLTGAKAFTERDPVPLAWLDGTGRVVDPEEMRTRLVAASLPDGAVPTPAEDLAAHTLLARLDGAWGDPLYVRVALPVLLQGDGLMLKRVGQRVLWQRRQVWEGRVSPSPTAREDAAEAVALEGSDDVQLQEGTDRSAKGIPLLANHFVYSYAREHRGEPVLIKLGRYLLTPPAVILDWVMQTSVVYLDVLRWMSHGMHQNWDGPFTDEKKR